MSAAQFDLGIRLRAYQERRFLPRTSTTRFTLRPDARVVAIVASPGDHSGAWGLAWGTLNGRPTIATASDPRPWSSQVQLWEQVGESWAGWLSQCVEREEHAQFVVADNAASDRITWSARKVASSDHVSPTARAAARAFIIAHHHSRAAGQQSIAAMTSLLQEHFVAGADPLAERHLGFWTAWPVLRPGWDDPQTAIPAGADHADAPLGRAWDKMIRHTSKGASELGEVFGQNVCTAVRKLVISRWDTLRTATKVYLNHPGQPTPLASSRAAKESKDFTYLMSNERLPATRSMRATWRTLADRESAAEAWQASLWGADRLERARGVASGDVLAGQAEAGRVTTFQPVLRLRPGDRLATSAGTTARVEALEAEAGALVVTLACDLDGQIEAWPAAVDIRQPIPDEVPWTHDASIEPGLMPRPAGNLLAQVKALRTTV